MFALLVSMGPTKTLFWMKAYFVPLLSDSFIKLFSCQVMTYEINNKTHKLFSVTYCPLSVETRRDNFFVNYLLSESSSSVSTFYLHTTFTTTPFAQN